MRGKSIGNGYTGAIIITERPPVPSRRDTNGYTGRMDEKKQMRTKTLVARDRIPASERTHRSREACHALERHFAALKTGATVAVYAAMHSEVDLEAFVEAAFARGWRVCFPCMVQGKEEHTRGSCEKAPGASLGTVEVWTEGTGVAGASISETAEAAGGASFGHGSPRMEFYLVERERLDHAREAFLSKPLRCLPCTALAQQGYTAVTPTELDGVVVPLVAFDDAGNRLGYGGGNYDRLLARIRPDAAVVGIAFEEQRVPSIPTEPHDRALRTIVVA